MKAFLLVLTLALCCLRFGSCSAQADTTGATARPRLLAAGTMVRSPVVGLTPAYYERLRLDRDADAAQLRIRADRLRLMQVDSALAAGQQATTTAELARCRTENASHVAELLRQAAHPPKPPRPPLVFDGRVYGGAAAGSLLTLALVVLATIHL